jgi:arylsulfatase A-like enzyme
MSSWAAPLLLLVAGCLNGGVADTGSATMDSRVEMAPLAPFLVPTGGSAPSNLLVISIDTLRRDRFGFLGDVSVTPNLDALALQGVVLSDHVSCANWTAPSMICGQTGRTSLQVGFHPVPGDLEQVYDQSFPTQEYFFRDAGFQAVLTTANYFFSGENGSALGFQQVVALGYQAAPLTLEAALGQLLGVADGDTPFYQHVHLVDPHTPYTAPQEWFGDTTGLSVLEHDLSTESGITAALRAYEGMDATERADLAAWFDLAYQADVRLMDDEIGTFLAAAEAAGALDDTLVLFWSDHGEQFWEDDLFGHGRALHDEEADSFALFWMADEGLVPGVWTGPTAGLDLPPTLMTLFELPLSEDYMGHPVGLAPAERRRISVHFDDMNSQLSLEKEGWKLIYHWDGTLELYNRSSDRGEETDLADQEPEMARDLYNLLRGRILELAALHPEVPAPADP